MDAEALRTTLIERGIKLLREAYSPEPFTKDPQADSTVAVRNDDAGEQDDLPR